MLGILGVLGIYAVYYYTILNAPPEEEMALVEDTKENPIMKITKIRKMIPKTPKEWVEDQHEWGKDLFSTTIKGTAEEGSSDFELTGIEFSESSSAIINGEPIRIGSFFSGYQVIDITKTKVTLYGNRENLVLTLGNDRGTGNANRDDLFQQGFEKAFRVARLEGVETFDYKGRTYHTRLKNE